MVAFSFLLLRESLLWLFLRLGGGSRVADGGPRVGGREGRGALVKASVGPVGGVVAVGC